jgi:hypothetical protein
MPPDPPTITSFSPSHGRPSTRVTIRGQFDGFRRVDFGNQQAQARLESDGTIVATVPQGPGPLKVKIKVITGGGTVISAKDFEID